MATHVKIDRKILNWEWYTDVNVAHLFIYLILRANWQDGNWKGNPVKRGQVIVGIKKLATSTGLSEMQIRTCILKLKKTNEITCKVTSKFTLITICKYDIYQTQKESDNTQDNTNVTHNSTDKQHTSNTQVTTNKNLVNNNKEEEKRVNGHSLENSNLFRKPVVPTKNQVWEAFSGIGGTKEMAKKFYDKYEGTGWFLNGSPIINFKSLVGGFIATWKKNDQSKNPDPTNVKIVLK